MEANDEIELTLDAIGDGTVEFHDRNGRRYQVAFDQDRIGEIQWRDETRCADNGYVQGGSLHPSDNAYRTVVARAGEEIVRLRAATRFARLTADGVRDELDAGYWQ